jgi:hypothetical protein
LQERTSIKHGTTLEDAEYLLEMPPELEHYDVSVASGLKL